MKNICHHLESNDTVYNITVLGCLNQDTVDFLLDTVDNGQTVIL